MAQIKIDVRKEGIIARKGRSVMNEVNFSDDLWLFASPWCERTLEHGEYVEKIAHAWVALWNHSVDPTSMKIDDLSRICKGLFDIPTIELTAILSKRKAVFFPDDNRLINGYRVTCAAEDFSIFVTFAEPDSVKD